MDLNLPQQTHNAVGQLVKNLPRLVKMANKKKDYEAIMQYLDIGLTAQNESNFLKEGSICGFGKFA